MHLARTYARVTPLLALTVLAVAAVACAPSGGSAPVPSGGPTSRAASGTTTGSAAAASGEAAGSSAGSTVWLPDWADDALPDAVANRRPLPFCGVERPPAAQPRVFVDRIVRLCFRDAAEHGDEAEWVSIQGTMEGGTVATVYRALRDGTIEVLTDWTQDRFGPGGWTRMTCRDVVEAEGDELIGVDGCDEAVPLP